MSKRDIQSVCTLAAHLAVIDTVTAAPKYRTAAENRAPLYAADAMKLQRLGRSMRSIAAKHWIHPEERDTREEIQPYLNGCQRVHREVLAVLAPYGMESKDIVVSRDGVTILALPGDHNAMFGRGFLI